MLDQHNSMFSYSYKTVATIFAFVLRAPSKHLLILANERLETPGWNELLETSTELWYVLQVTIWASSYEKWIGGSKVR